MNPLILCIHYDTRLKDNPALYAAAETGKPILLVYIHEDDAISVQYYGSAQILRIRQSLLSFENNLKEHYQAKLILKSGNRCEIIQSLITETLYS